MVNTIKIKTVFSSNPLNHSIIAIGPPHSGKTSLYHFINTQHPNQITHISIGTLIRNGHFKTPPAGEKLDDQLALPYLEDQITHCHKSNQHFFLDGNPLDLVQFNFLHSLVTRLGASTRWIELLPNPQPRQRRYCSKCDFQTSDPQIACPKCHISLLTRKDNNLKRLDIYDNNISHLRNNKQFNSVIEIGGLNDFKEYYQPN